MKQNNDNILFNARGVMGDYYDYMANGSCKT
jgi:hypothetical protein